MTVSANKRVWGKVTSLSLGRDGSTLNATWKVPQAMKYEEFHDRAEWLLGEIDFDVSGTVDSGTVHCSNYGGPITSDDATGALKYYKNWIDGLSLTQKLDATFSRSWFHPVKKGKYCTKVSIGIYGMNGSGRGGDTVWCARTMSKPNKPTVTWEYNAGTSTATVTVKSDAGDQWREKHDTMRRITIRKQDGTTATLADWASTSNDEYTWSKDLSAYLAGLTSGKYVQIKCEAYSRGMAGDTDVVTAVRNVALPVAATLGTVKCDKKTSTGRIEVPVTPGAYTLGLQLQRRKGETGSWSDVSGATDNADCKALYDSYGDADPQPGEYVYYRVKTTRDGYTVYSASKRADCLFTAKPKVVCSASVGIVSTSPAKTGTSASVVMGYTDSTSNTGCELSWSSNYNAWSSTDGPSTATFTGNDTTTASTKYSKTRTVTMSNLTSGTTYYVRMRRYRTVDGETLYSGYSSRASFRTESASGDTCGIAEVSCGSDGSTATIVVGINENNANTGTELTWSDHSSAWQSNEQPELLNATWARASYNTGGWTYKQTIYLRGLEQGTTYYARARRYLEAGGNTTYTSYSKTASFRTPKKSETDPDLRCGLVSVTGGEDGVSAEVVVGWSGSRDGCEVSWSTDPDAWQSSVQPDTATFDWQDESRRSNSWSKTGTFFLHGLEEGTTYYVKARTYVEVDSDTVWSDYTSDVSVTPYSSPKSVTLSAPSAVARGESIELYWTVEGELEQTEWRVHKVGYPKTSLASGTGSLCHASVPASRYGSASSISLYVEAGYGGGLTESNAVTVGIADVPKCEIATSSPLTAQPASFEVYTDDPGASVIATCMSEGISYDAPDGERDQLAGDVVWTAALAPAWTEATWDDTVLRDQLSDAVDDAEEAYGDAVDQATFAATSDESVQDGTSYYSESSGDYTFVDPVSAVDPSDEGWYEESGGSYSATSDTSVEAGKLYYVRSGSGTDESPYVYTAVEPVTAVNPSDEGWYYVPDDGEAAACDNARTALEEAEAALAAHPADGAVHMCEVEVPESAAFHDGGSYRFAVSAVEPVAGLVSDEATKSFKVTWSHQAPSPSNAVTVVPNATSRSVTITLATPADAVETDVYDVYRKTPTGYTLVAFGLALDDMVIDKYAPYGKNADLKYRVCTRTADGDLCFRDYAYSMDVNVLRVDWDGGSVELPYNIGLSESRAKSFESRAHVDGSTSGRWNKSIESKSSYSSDAIVVNDYETADAVRRLGEFPGSCFVRDATGMAFQANVDVPDLSHDYTSPYKVTVRLDAAMVDTGQEFWLKDGKGAAEDEGEIEEAQE